MFTAFYQPGDKNFATLFGKSNYACWMGNDKALAWSVFTHRLDGGHNLWGIGAINQVALVIFILVILTKLFRELTAEVLEFSLFPIRQMGASLVV